MLEQAQTDTGSSPISCTVLGTTALPILKPMRKGGLDAYICTCAKTTANRHGTLAGRPPKNLYARNQLERELKLKARQGIYALCHQQTVIWPVFSQINESRV